MMSSQPELPPRVINAIQANRKIDAIKLLREERDLGLKEAKHIVDAYMLKNPQPVSQRSSGGSAGAIVLLIVVVAAAFAAYRFFS